MAGERNWLLAAKIALEPCAHGGATPGVGVWGWWPASQTPPRAVLRKPQVILADEPTASLGDAAAADAVGLLLQTARTQGATLGIATHDARVATFLVAENNGEIGLQRLSLERGKLSKEEQERSFAATPLADAMP